MFQTVHPKISKGERIGQTTKFRCQFCRFINDANDRRSQSIENETDGMIITTNGTRATSLVAGSGCANCGSLNWSNRIPSGLITRPEDRPRAAGRWRMKRDYIRF